MAAAGRDPLSSIIRGAFIAHHWTSALMAPLSAWVAVCDELVIVVNGSQGTLLEDLADLPAAANVFVLHGHGNVGYGTAANLAFKHPPSLGSHDVFVVINSDALPVDPASLRRELRTAKYDIACLSLQFPDGGIQRTAAPFPTATSLLKTLVIGEQRVRGPLGVSRYPIGAVIVVRASAFLAVEGFDPDFFLYYEEVDLFRRLAYLDLAWVELQSPVSHACAASTSHYQGALDYELGRSAGIYCRRHARYPRMWRLALRGLLWAGSLRHGKAQRHRNRRTATGLRDERRKVPVEEILRELEVVPVADRRRLGNLNG